MSAVHAMRVYDGYLYLMRSHCVSMKHFHIHNEIGVYATGIGGVLGT
jgi:hypothetical protein